MTLAAKDESKTEFQRLLGDLDTLAKATATDSADDKKIVAAMRDGEKDDKKKDPEDAEDDDELGGGGKNGKGKDGKAMTKSLSVTLADGTVVEAEDGTELVKALTEQLGALTTRIEESETSMVKALGTAVTLIKAQSASIAGLQDQIKTLSGEGRGRKAVLTVIDRKAEGTTLAKGGDGVKEPTVGEFLAKAEVGFKAGKISGQHLCYIESAINRGEFGAIPPSLRDAVAAL